MANGKIEQKSNRMAQKVKRIMMSNVYPVNAVKEYHWQIQGFITNGVYKSSSFNEWYSGGYDF